MHLILGYGKSGKATEKYFKSIDQQIIIYDEGQNLIPKINWQKIKSIIQSPGIPANHPISMLAKEYNIPIQTDINLLQQKNNKTNYIGITGTNGKSTTTELIGHILKQAGLEVAVGGNIGTPVLELPNLSSNGWYILELSSYQLELSNPIPLNTAVWLNISPDHLERHKTIENYVNTKQRIFLNSVNAIIGIDDIFSEKTAANLNISTKTVSINSNQSANYYVDNSGILNIDQQIFDLQSIDNLMGKHNWQNIALAFATTLPIIKNSSQIFAHIKTFPGLEHRQQKVATIENVLFINDSKATNADATEKALLAYKDYEIFWILGGKDKTDGIDSLKSYFNKIKKAYLIGEAATRFSKTLNNIVDHINCHNLETAITHAFNDAKKFNKSVVLFSPACASFDQFKDFEHRGAEFQKLVKAITC